MLELELMLLRRRLFFELLIGFFLVISSSFAMAESGSGSSGSGSSNSGSGQNDDSDDDDDDDEQRDARSAVKSGNATALRDILRKVKKKFSGEIVHVGLKKRSQRLVYLIKLIDPAGKLLLVRIDAKSGTILGEDGS